MEARRHRWRASASTASRRCSPRPTCSRSSGCRGRRPLARPTAVLAQRRGRRSPSRWPPSWRCSAARPGSAARSRRCSGSSAAWSAAIWPRAPGRARSSPELRQLAASFNGMASTLAAPGRAAGKRGAAARGRRDRRRRHHHDQPARPDRVRQSRGERLFGYRQRRADRPERPDPDAVARSRAPRRVPGALSAHRRGADHRHRPRGHGPAQGRLGRCRCPCRSASSALEGERFFTGILRDITERKRAEERQRLLMAEIDHRAKNLLASIQAMVLLTKPTPRSVGDYAKTLIGRLHAMARAHDLLARDKWTGASLHDADPATSSRPMSAPTAPGSASSARTRA